MSYSAFIKLCLLTVCSSIFFLSTTKADSAFPADIPRCHTGDTDCVIRVIKHILQQYSRKGYPAVGLPIIEPFHLKAVDLSDNQSGSLSLKLSLRDADIEGVSGVNIDRAVGFGADPSTSKYELHGSAPKISIRSKYKVDGQIMILPIRGNGDADFIFENCQISVKFKPSTYVKNGKTYLAVDKLKVLIEPKKLKIKMTNLFNGDQALGDNMNQFLNENWSDVWTALQPSIHKALAEVMKSIITPMLTTFAYKDLFDDLAQ